MVIFETNTIDFENDAVNVDVVIETSSHFRCIDIVIDQAGTALSEKFIKELYSVLKPGTSDSRKDQFAVGEYKKLPNEVGGNDTTLPEDVAGEMSKLLAKYNALPPRPLRLLLPSMLHSNVAIPSRTETVAQAG